MQQADIFIADNINKKMYTDLFYIKIKSKTSKTFKNIKTQRIG